MEVQQASLRISLDGPAQRYVGRPADFTIKVTNPGGSPLSNVQVSFRRPAELAITAAGQDGVVQNDSVTWQLPALGPGEERVFTVTANCQAISPRALSVAQATAAPGLSVHTVPWLYEREVAAVTADTSGLEVQPNEIEVFNPIHVIALVHMGMAMGEIFDFEELADTCADLAQYAFLFVAPVLPITGASGSATGAIAIL